jgi:hypothetical protein
MRLFALDGLSALIDDLPRDNFRKHALRTIAQLLLRLSSSHGLTVFKEQYQAIRPDDGRPGSNFKQCCNKIVKRGRLHQFF